MEHRLTSRPGAGVQVEVTPATAGWRYLSFKAVGLPAGESWEGRMGREEACVVLLGGDCLVRVGSRERACRGRRDVFEGLPYFAYVPPGAAFRFHALTDCELAWGSAPADQGHPPRVLGPEDCSVEMRGDRNVTRQITHLVDPGFGCQRLLAVEVYTPSGNWSSYPPHRHDADRLPHEVNLDEIYYYRMAEGGFAIQRLYDGQGMDDLVLVRDRDTVLVRRGYHPVVAAPGFDVYYLNFLAGDHPSWVTCDDPQLAWVREIWNSPQPLELPMRAPSS